MIAAYQHGIYPRSEALVAATRDLERGRLSQQAADERSAEDLREFVALQRQAGMDYFSDGSLRWQDLFRPLVEACPGLKAGPLVRWFDNNSFFRAPEVVGSISLEGLPEVYDTARELPEPRMASLPSPLLFSRVALAQADRNQLMRELALGLLRPVAERLAAQGYGLIQLQEPWLAFHGIDAGDWEPFAESLGLITDGLGVTTVLHTYFGDVGPSADRLRRLPVSAVGIDFTETDVSALGSRWETGLLVGCLDGRNSVLEPVEDAVDFVRRVVDAAQPPNVYVSSNSDLELLPREVAKSKVLRLGEAARRLKELLA